MHLTIEREAMLNALTQVAAVVERRNTIPVLSNICMRAVNDQLTLTGTDLDIEIAVTIEARIIAPGAITAPATALLDIARKSDKGAELELNFDGAKDARLKVKFGRSNYVLPVLPAADFPTMDGVKDGVSYHLLRSDLQRLIDTVKHAVSTEETRYYLNGAYLHHFDDGGGSYLRLVATDGHRLAMAEMPAPDGCADAAGIIIPRKTIAIIRQIIETAADVQVTLNKDKIEVRAGKAMLTSKVIDGSFPDYGRVIPRGEGKTTARLDAPALARGVDRVAMMSQEKSSSARFDFADEVLTMTVRNIDAGGADTQVDIELEGPPVSIGFNARFVNDAMAVIGDGRITCHFTDASGPVRVNVEADSGIVFVLMPLRV